MVVATDCKSSTQSWYTIKHGPPAGGNAANSSQCRVSCMSVVICSQCLKWMSLRPCTWMKPSSWAAHHNTPNAHPIMLGASSVVEHRDAGTIDQDHTCFYQRHMVHTARVARPQSMMTRLQSSQDHAWTLYARNLHPTTHHPKRIKVKLQESALSKTFVMDWDATEAL